MLRNKELLAIASQYPTPFYLYDGNSIEKQYQLLQNAFKNTSNFQVNYAVKALSTIRIIQFVKKLGAKIDTVSINEVKLALQAGYLPQEISFTPNGVPFEEIEEAMALKVHITLDNYEQIKRIAQKKESYPIGLRINPKVKDGGNKKIKVAGKNSKFGLPLEHLPKIHQLVDNYQLKVIGLHIHVGSDVSNITSYLASAQVLFDTAKTFKQLQFINFGGGFKVKYKEDDTFIDIHIFGDQITSLFNAFNKTYPSDLKLIIEPGKFLVSKAGYFLTKVSVIKKKNVFVNSGFNHFIRPMYYNAYHNVRNISSDSPAKKNYHIVGYVCEQDNFAKNRKINKPHIGDILCFDNAGAYSFTMASNYNSRLRPMELFVYNDTIQIIREKETFNDLLNHQVY